MERHMEKVQTVGNLLDSRDNFTMSWRILGRNYGNRDFTNVHASELETSNNYRERSDLYW